MQRVWGLLRRWQAACLPGHASRLHHNVGRHAAARAQLSPPLPFVMQIDPDVAFRSRLRRVEVDLRTGVQRISASFDQYLEMVAINESRFGCPHRYVYGCELCCWEGEEGELRGQGGRPVSVAGEHGPALCCCLSTAACSNCIVCVAAVSPWPADNSVFDVPQIGLAKVGRNNASGACPSAAKLHLPPCIVMLCNVALSTIAHSPPLAQVDMEGRTVSLYRPGHQHFCLEPKFVPRPGATEEDDGWLLSVGFHSGATGQHGGRKVVGRDVEGARPGLASTTKGDAAANGPLCELCTSPRHPFTSGLETLSCHSTSLPKRGRHSSVVLGHPGCPADGAGPGGHAPLPAGEAAAAAAAAAAGRL